jgi:glyoxylase-like metal-dependent hydrolase (beta-lactamase superfamily II)
MRLFPVLPGVFQIDLPLVNVWVLHRDGRTAVIDTGVRQDRRALLAGLSQVMGADGRVESVLLSHGHCDHAGNAAFLADRFGARLHAHANEAPFIATRRTYVPRGIRALGVSGLLFAVGEVVFPVKRHRVDILLRDGERVDTPIGPLTVLETPGHTPGHVSYFHEENGWLFSGDAVINVIPFLRRTALSLPVPVFNSDFAGVLKSARRLADLGPAVLLPGHGWSRLENVATDLCAFADRVGA